MPCLLHRGLTKHLPSGLTDVVEDVGSGSEVWQVLLLLIKAHAQSPSACLEEAEGTFYSHAAPQPVAEMLLPVSYLSL